ncbi:hypothetical protein A2630_03715 [Candidatus Woesebacteria bacterium RIFCSPHIGHO2_01_FULL_44_10]|uniref:Diacylglycerol kinase n=1 Tax=Candidatus Woesebacteria bacterium RIFCSPLOWO2_01_FULL_44_14 TaxID=1802525 RepID=A0A1F8C385_9BACT|nr:MAG: hypothetical protein A2630_03715 [Candidatus Woesebacteria bacterium RIFCSPHIGHO2_01_FULL_44_10]OGM54898.1 MAG: hypothetical protein A3F62_04400 [Candidatus Woesebacteria bacterium RIFCSPHIGHO2_12_FULL_44_11]OGM70309.1 MAG: hypothetical protein A2975_04545 [Candidatus Woesebacteria bacterium RIFCSPLOWO2_01_FULL_44_14]
MSQKGRLTRSFKYAFAGIGSAMKSEPNFRIHSVIALVVLVAAAVLGFNYLEWLILLLVIYFVLILELINTVLEKIVDLASPEINPQAKAAKDISAAAVLFSAVLAIVAGLVLFIPKIWPLIQP